MGRAGHARAGLEKPQEQGLGVGVAEGGGAEDRFPLPFLCTSLEQPVQHGLEACGLGSQAHAPDLRPGLEALSCVALREPGTRGPAPIVGQPGHEVLMLRVIPDPGMDQAHEAAPAAGLHARPAPEEPLHGDHPRARLPQRGSPGRGIHGHFESEARQEAREPRIGEGQPDLHPSGGDMDLRAGKAGLQGALPERLLQGVPMVFGPEAFGEGEPPCLALLVAGPVHHRGGFGTPEGIQPQEEQPDASGLVRTAEGARAPRGFQQARAALGPGPGDPFPDGIRPFFRPQQAGQVAMGDLTIGLAPAQRLLALEDLPDLLHVLLGDPGEVASRLSQVPAGPDQLVHLGGRLGLHAPLPAQGRLDGRGAPADVEEGPLRTVRGLLYLPHQGHLSLQGPFQVLPLLVQVVRHMDEFLDARSQALGHFLEIPQPRVLPFQALLVLVQGPPQVRRPLGGLVRQAAEAPTDGLQADSASALLGEDRRVHRQQASLLGRLIDGVESSLGAAERLDPTLRFAPEGFDAPGQGLGLVPQVIRGAPEAPELFRPVPGLLHEPRRMRRQALDRQVETRPLAHAGAPQAPQGLLTLPQAGEGLPQLGHQPFDLVEPCLRLLHGGPEGLSLDAVLVRPEAQLQLDPVDLHGAFHHLPQLTAEGHQPLPDRVPRRPVLDGPLLDLPQQLIQVRPFAEDGPVEGLEALLRPAAFLQEEIERLRHHEIRRLHARRRREQGAVPPEDAARPVGQQALRRQAPLPGQPPPAEQYQPRGHHHQDGCFDRPQEGRGGEEEVGRGAQQGQRREIRQPGADSAQSHEDAPQVHAHPQSMRSHRPAAPPRQIWACGGLPPSSLRSSARAPRSSGGRPRAPGGAGTAAGP